jgi:hypothetical protein
VYNIGPNYTMRPPKKEVPIDVASAYWPDQAIPEAHIQEGRVQVVERL